MLPGSAARPTSCTTCVRPPPRAARVVEDAMTAMVLPAAMRLYMRTSNYLERLNREIERHACFVGVFPSKVSAIRLIGSVLTEENECSSTQRKSYYG